MSTVLVIQGAGMDQRGKTQVEIFGPETLEEIDAQIRAQAKRLGLSVEIFQSNDEQAVVAQLQSFAQSDLVAVLINPGGFTTADGSLPQALADLPVPAYEIHASNPSARGVHSTLQPVCKGSICGFGYDGYRMALEAVCGLQRAS